MDFDARLLSGIGTLVAVAETGSFARAAESLGMTASGVSRAVARLEGRLGIRLFNRNARATTLTEAGQHLLAEVSPLLASIVEAADGARGEASAVRGRLRLNCDSWFASLLLAPHLQPFLDAYPGLSLAVVVRDRLGDLVSEGFDAAVRFGEPEPSGLITRKLLETRILTCASPSYIARRGGHSIRAISQAMATSACSSAIRRQAVPSSGSSAELVRCWRSPCKDVSSSTMSRRPSPPALRV